MALSPVRPRRCRSAVILFILLFGGALSSVTTCDAARANNSTLRMPSQFPIVGYGATQAFGGLTFDQPVGIVSAPGETNRLFILEKTGRILVITNLANPTKTEFLDVRAELFSNSEAGLLGAALHPGHRTNGHLYVFRTVASTVDGTHHGLYLELARYTVDEANPNVARPESRQVLFREYDNHENHNGGDIKFGPDGYLYVPLGYEGPAPSADTPEPQPIDRHFHGSILRIDVDKRPGNLAPNPFPGGSTNYAIPSDNPFIGLRRHRGREIDPGRTRTEIYAVGFRNPWRISFDGTELYCADAGSALVEEVNLVRAGGDYGWPFAEGHHSLLTPPAGAVFEEPFHKYTRSSGPHDGHCIIGGHVYHGDRIPQLRGAYVFGDFASGRIVALRRSGSAVESVESLTHVPAITTFGVDPSNGDLLVASLEGTINRLIYAAPETVAHPATLADTGAFEDLAALKPAGGIVPYEVSVPFWSDNAIKRRWFALTEAGQRFGFNATSHWTFPAGAVWIKHFELELRKGAADSRQRLETRLLVKNETGIYGVTYRWGESRTNAFLVPEGGMTETFTIRDGQKTEKQTWIYPSRSDCIKCHNAGAGYVLGFNTPQLNCEVPGPGTAANQLTQLAAGGYVDVTNVAPGELAVLADAIDGSAPIEHRFRSYVQANCAACHFPGGPSGMRWDARITNPLSAANLLDAQATSAPAEYRIIAPGDPMRSILLTRISQPHGRMPPLGTSLLDTGAIALVTEYTRSVPGRPWTRTNIGRVSREGSASVTTGHHAITGTGTNISGTADAAALLSQPLSPGGQMSARLRSMQAEVTFAGLTMRGSSEPEAPHVTIGASAGNEAEVRVRRERGGTTTTTRAGGAAGWLRLNRTGDRVQAFTSENGSAWTRAFDGTIPLGSEAIAGFVVCSTGSVLRATASFDTVRVVNISATATIEGSSSRYSEPVMLAADVSTYGASIEKVTFHDGDTAIGEVRTAPYVFSWTEAFAGSHSIVATATDNSGMSVASMPIPLERPMPPTKATMAGSDVATTGQWRDSYGADGYQLAGIATNSPPHVRWTMGGQAARSPGSKKKPRALLHPAGTKRTVAMWSDRTNLTFDVELRDAALHRLALYFVDWGTWGKRMQLVELLDATTGAVLSSNVVEKFRNGIYLTHYVRGSVRVRISRLAGENVVLSGVFLDRCELPEVRITSPRNGDTFMAGQSFLIEAEATGPVPVTGIEIFSDGVLIPTTNEIVENPDQSKTQRVSWQMPFTSTNQLHARAADSFGRWNVSPRVTVTAGVPQASAQLLGIDAGTKGSWRGKYGSEGYAIATDATNYPAYARVNMGSARPYQVTPSPEERAIQRASGDERLLSVWYDTQWTTDLLLADGAPHVVSTYFLDPESSREQRVEVLDAGSGKVLYETDLPMFDEGKYYTWLMRGHLQIRLTSHAGPNAVMSGLFFDPAAAPPHEGSGPAVQQVDGHVRATLRFPAGEEPRFEISNDLITWREAGDEIRILSKTKVLPGSGSASFDEVTIELATPTAKWDRCFIRAR